MNKLLAALALSAASTVAVAQEQVVNVYNWSDYIDDSIIAEFEAETGIKVRYDVFDSNEIVETKLLAGGTGYDVVVPSADFLKRQISAGVFQPLDASKLDNTKNMWDVVNARVDAYDPGAEYSRNYMWGTTGIGYNVSAAEERGVTVDSWSVVFDPEQIAKFEDCGVHFLDAPSEMFVAALNYLGKNPDSREPADIEEATELMMKVRPFVQKFNSSEYINGLANGDICLAVGFSGDVFQARDRAAEADAGVEVGYVIPKEGSLMWFDQMAVPADAPNVENAHTFINYIMRPEVIAKASDYVFYANGNLAAQELMDKEVLDDPAIYPPAEVMEKLYTVQPYDPRTNRIVTRAWTQVKTGQ